MPVLIPGGAARPQFYDRNAVDSSASYNTDAVAPHGQTDRIDITVTAGKNAFMEGGFVTIRRRAAASALEKAYVQLKQGSSIIERFYFQDNNVGAVLHIPLPVLGFFQGGTRLRLTSADESTGGTLDYHLHLKLTEFDP